MHAPTALRHAALPGLAVILVWSLALPAHAAGVVGTGTPAGCTEAALTAALAGGGIVTFNCGANAVTIPITSTKALAQSTTIDGGNRITLQGNGNVRLFDLSGAANYVMTNLSLGKGMAQNGNGGAIRVTANSLLLYNVRLFNNTASGQYSRGGAVYSFGGTPVTLQRVTATGNTAQSGGAFANAGTDTLTLSEVAAQDNTSGTDGGAIFHTGTALDIKQSLFSNNQSNSYGASGGAIVVSPSTTSTLAIVNSTFHHNRRSGGGGGGNAIGVINGVSAGTILSSTFADNGGSPGSIAVYGNSQLTLRNTIVSNTTGQPNCTVSGSAGAAIVDGGNNLQFGGSVAQSCGATIPVADPRLTPLANNGGFTQTMAQMTGSPVIDAGHNCPSTDQRGVTRPIGLACDIGAFEGTSPILFRSGFEAGEN